MEKKNVVREKAYAFALDIVAFCRSLIEKKEYILSKQLIRSGTSIGAQLEEAQQARSRKDFHGKISIALQEAYESRYWLKLIRDSGYESSRKTEVLLRSLDEIIRLLVAIHKSTNDG